jgi:hypothetical protein
MGLTADHLATCYSLGICLGFGLPLDGPPPPAVAR